jgi:UDP-N-acetylglucosamine--N-acetylmuramyl-(pentapeptide) pyrophosphoryl-undecaprenol N-acetylglucosamine transferase
MRRDPADRSPRPWRTIAVLGGSQGARRLNQTVAALLPALTRLRGRLRFVHAAGPDHGELERAYRRWGFAADVAPFFTDIAERIADADLAVCRGGGSTVAELLVLGVPSIIVPYPFCRDGHQEANARFVTERGAGVAYAQSTFHWGFLLKHVRELLFGPGTWEARARCAYRLGRPNAARAVAEVAFACAGPRVRGGKR